MRKTVSSSHIVKALREFGEIDVAAVASGQRGFGIVRFRNPKSATLAIRRYRSGEIVVQDVAVQMQVLTPSGAVEGRLAGRRS
jgi:RNA recognition motif-containing protein